MTDIDVTIEPPVPPQRPRWRRPLAIVVAVAVLGAVTAAVALTVTDDRSSPSAWDHRVAPIARFVERERGLRFRHPVPIDFLSVPDFQHHMRQKKALSAKDRRQLDQTVDALRALGLVHGKVDLHALVGKFIEQGVIGVYEPETKHVYVRGKTLNAYGRVTLAHELTHALQDQRLDLHHLETLEDTPGEAATSLVEGDAVRVQLAYQASLSAADQASFAAAAQADEKASDLSGIPGVLLHSFTFPYAFGPGFVEALAASGGTKAIDRAFANPPRSEAQIISPDRYLSHVPIVRVGRPRLGPGERRIQAPGEIGQASLLEMLGNVVGYTDAWRAVSGWRGDQWLLYTRGNTTCVAITTALDTDADLAAFAGVARRWAAAVPGATVTTSARTAEVRSCDPGPDAPAVKEASSSAWDALQVRGQLILAAIRSHKVSAAVAACAADHVIDAVGPDPLTKLNEGEVPPGLMSRLPGIVASAGAACRTTKPGTIGP